MNIIKSYKDLIVWQKSIELVVAVFALTNLFPKSELYGIITQMRRAAISIPSNIAEGYGRRTVPQYKHFYSISYGSALELETQIIIAKKLGFAKPEDYKQADQLLEEVSKMLNSMLYKKLVTYN